MRWPVPPKAIGRLAAPGQPMIGGRPYSLRGCWRTIRYNSHPPGIARVEPGTGGFAACDIKPRRQTPIRHARSYGVTNSRCQHLFWAAGFGVQQTGSRSPSGGASFKINNTKNPLVIGLSGSASRCQWRHEAASSHGVGSYSFLPTSTGFQIAWRTPSPCCRWSSPLASSQ